MKRGGAHLHFHADDSSVHMMMDPISSANDICVVFGTCDYLYKMNEIDLQSQRNTASIVLIGRVSEDLTQPRPCVAENVSREASSQGHHLRRILGLQTANSRRQRDTSCKYRINKQERQLSKERTNRQPKKLIDRVKLQTAQKS